MNNDVTILVNSCDFYRDAWEPFFKIFSDNWNNCPYKLALNTETADFKSAYCEVDVIHPKTTGNLTWSRRFREAVEQIDSPFIVFMLEDYFVLNQVNTQIFSEAVKVMKNNPSVGAVFLSKTNKTNIKTSDYEDDFFYSRVIDNKNKLWCSPMLYRKDFLLKIIRDKENIWELEQYGYLRAKRLKYLVLQPKSNYPEIITYSIKIENGIGITMKKWLPGNVKLFNDHNITVDFDNLGFYNPIKNISDDKTKQSKSANKSLKEALFNIKKLPRKIKRKIQKSKIYHYF